MTGEPSPDHPPKEHAMETLSLDVPTVHCRSCKLNIEETLDELPGVAASDVDVDAKTVTVTYDPDAVRPNAIASSVEQAGYPVGPDGTA